MADDKQFFYPVTEETIHGYAASIFRPIRRGECVTTVWVPMAGRRRHNKFVIENIQLFAKELPEYKKYLLVYIEPLDLTEESLSGYLRLMAKSLIEVCNKDEVCKKISETETNSKVFDDETASYSKLLDGLRYLLGKIIDSGFEIVFFLGEFDELTFANNIIYNNLEGLWAKFEPRLHLVFLIREMVTKQSCANRFGSLCEAMLQNIVYIPILAQSDFDYMIRRLAYEYNFQAPKDYVEIMKTVCGGHPYLLKAAFRILKEHSGEKLSGTEIESLLVTHYELRSVAKGILEVLDRGEKAVLKKIVNMGTVDEMADSVNIEFQKKLGLISQKGKGGYSLFSKLFEIAVKALTEEKEVVISKGNSLTFNKESGVLLLNEKTIEERLTRQEYSVLAMFLRNESKLCTRDDIGEVLWGKESYEKYSDWAIDQLISKLRKKLGNFGLENAIKTIKGRGYKYVQSP